MDPTSLAIGKITKLQAMVNTHGMMEENMKVSGNTISWMAMGFVNIKMEECTMECIRITKSMAMEYMSGLMAESTMASGQMVSNTAQENKYQVQVKL